MSRERRRYDIKRSQRRTQNEAQKDAVCGRDEGEECQNNERAARGGRILSKFNKTLTKRKHQRPDTNPTFS